MLTLEDIARNLKRKKDATLYPRGRKNLEEFFPYISDYFPLEMMASPNARVYNLAPRGVKVSERQVLRPSNLAATKDTSKLICYSNLLVGHAHLGFFFDGGRVIHEYVNTIINHIRSTDVTVDSAVTEVITEQLVLVLIKKGRRRIINYEDIVEYIRYAYSNHVTVRTVDISVLTTAEQITLAQRATVIITPEGGISFFCAFSRLHSTAIIPGHYDMDLDVTTHLESTFWDTYDVVDVMYYFPDRETELVFEGKWAKRKGKKRGKGGGKRMAAGIIPGGDSGSNSSSSNYTLPYLPGEYRDLMSLQLNMSSFHRYIDAALHKAEHSFNFISPLPFARPFRHD